MSVSLVVNDPKPVHVSVILPKIRAALRAILGLSYDPEFVVEMRNGENTPHSDYIDPNKETGFWIWLKGEPPVTRVFSYKGSKDFVIVPQNWRCYAVAAAVAIAIAEHSRTEIVDSQSTYTKEEYMRPGDFAELIKASETFDDLDEAIEAFWEHILGITGKK